MQTEEEVLNSEISSIEIKEKDERYHWHVFYVKGKHERKAKELLERDGFDCYLPMNIVHRQYTDRKKKIEEPLFKSYIFVLIQQHEVYDVIKTPSVVTYVKYAGKPAIIRQKDIDLIRKLILNKTEFEVTNRKIKIGDQINITSGFFKGQKGVVKQLRGKKRLLIAIESTALTLEIAL
jgi:transcription antitermination factor NusG